MRKNCDPIADDSTKPIRVFALPAPNIATHGIHIPFCLPIQEFGSESRIGIAGGHITRATRREFVRHLAATNFFKGLDDIKYAVTDPGTKIDFEAYRLIQTPKALR